MRTSRSLSALLLVSSFFVISVPAQAQVRTVASVSIREPAGVSVIKDVIAQANIRVTIIGKIGDAVGVAVPGSVTATNVTGQSIQLTTSTSQLLYASGVILTEDTVSVDIGAAADGDASDAAPGNYDGVIVVIAQYN